MIVLKKSIFVGVPSLMFMLCFSPVHAKVNGPLYWCIFNEWMNNYIDVFFCWESKFLLQSTSWHIYMSVYYSLKFVQRSNNNKKSYVLDLFRSQFSRATGMVVMMEKKCVFLAHACYWLYQSGIDPLLTWGEGGVDKLFTY